MKLSGDLAEILGIHVGDGCISINERYKEYALSGDINEEKEYYDEWVVPIFNKNIFEPLIKKKINAKEYKKNGTYGFYVFNDKVVDFFLQFGICYGSKLNIKIPKKILQNRLLSKRFLRGLFDTDGTLFFDKNRSAKNKINKVPNIKLGCTSKELIKQVNKILFDLGFHPRIKKAYKGKRDKNLIYSVLIYRKDDIKKWFKEIGFKSSKHYTKWLLFNKLGYYLPYTTLNERKNILKQKSL